MGDRKLNLNQPFLSVRSVRTRRAPSPALTSQKEDNKMTLPVAPRPPTYKSEMKTGPITNPGAVPFMWEQMPGQPKEEINPQAQKHKKPPVAPKLPPGRYPKANQSNSHDISKSTTESKSRTTNALLVSQTDAYADDMVKNPESKNEKTEELASSDSGGSEAFVDALDTLSRTESGFINCSVSGLSGMNELDSKPLDPKTREFMMDRFLPAAKAMVSETPHVAPKRQQQVVRERTHVKKAENQVKPTLRYGPSFTNRYSHYTKDEGEEDSDDEYDHSGNLPGVCGLFPRFCLKSPVYLLNPAPSMSVRTRVPMSPANKIKPKPSSAGSYSSTGNEVKSDASELQSIYKTRAAELEEKTSLRNGNATYHDAPLFEGKEVCIKQVNNTSESDGKGIKLFKDFLTDPEEFDSGPVVFERTVYVDTVHKTESPKSRSYSSPHVQEPQGVRGSDEEDCEMITKTMDQMLVADSFFDDLKKIGNEGFGVSSFDKWNKNQGTGMQKGLEEDVFIKFQSTVTRNAKAAEEDSAKSIARRKFLELPGPPPLPKSPSDSWLGRTLPSISSKNRSHLGTPTHPQNQFSKPSTGNFKWEAIVKSTNAERQHLRSSEELLTPIPEA